MIPLGRMFPKIMDGKIASLIVEYDHKVVAFAHTSERVLLCSPGVKIVVSVVASAALVFFRAYREK